MHNLSVTVRSTGVFQLIGLVIRAPLA